MGKIGDLWVKLGLKDAEFKKGLDDAGKQTEGFGKKMQSLKTVGLAAWTAMSAAVVKFAKDAISMTQTWGDKWNQTMAGVQSAYGTFVRQLSSGEGWSNLFSNMAQAYAKGKEIAAVLDEVFERKTSYSYQEAETQKRISELQLIMRDQSKSDAERKKAAKDIITEEEKLADIKREVWKQEADAHRDNFKLQTGLNDEQTDFLVKQYNQNRAIIKQAVEYSDKLKDLREQQKGAQKLAFDTGDTANYDKLTQQIRDLEADTSQTIKDVATLVSKYNRGNDSLVKAMADAEVAVINVDTEANNAIMRANSLLGSLESRATTTVKVVRDAIEPLAKVSGALGAGIAVSGMGDGGLMGGAARDRRLAAEAEANAAYWGRMQDAAQALADTIQDSLIGALDELANALAGVDGSSMATVAIALLRPMADMCVQLGTMIMMSGEAIEALKSGLAAMGGAAPIVAGAALIGIGVAAKAGVAALSRGMSSTSSVSATSSSSIANSSATQSELVITVQGVVKGSDILISGQNTMNAWAR